MYIHSHSTISRANSSEKGILQTIIDNEIGSVVNDPIYKEKIDPRASRRMSKIVKMGVYTALDAIQDRSIKGIVHATGLGCLADTEKFLSSFAGKSEGILSPTPFIQSTHNTIAGQIALLLKIQEYNMTHVQNGVSFECALLDAMSLSQEQNDFVLVGAADETVPVLDTIMDHYHLPKEEFAYGASSFVIGPESKGALAKVETCYTSKSQPKVEAVDLVLTGRSFFKGDLERGIDYSKYAGIFNTNAAFGLQMAVELLNDNNGNKKRLGVFSDLNSIAVVNNFNNEHYGVIKICKP